MTKSFILGLGLSLAGAFIVVFLMPSLLIFHNFTSYDYPLLEAAGPLIVAGVSTIIVSRFYLFR